MAETVETANDMIDLLKSTDIEVDFLLLDHDLGGEEFVDSDREDTGFEVVRWITEHKPQIKKIIVHSCNPSAGPAMVQVLSRIGYNAIYVNFVDLLSQLKKG